MQAARPATKPSKQRKMLYQAPNHIRHRLLAAHLSPQLRVTHIVKSLSVRSGDTVRVMRGDHKGFEGKISRVNLKKYRIYVEGLTREKVDGTTISVPVHPSKVLITNLNLDDKWRKKILDRKKEAHKKPKKVAEKPKKVAEKPKAKLEEKPPELVEKVVVEEKVVEEEKAVIEEKLPVEEKPVTEKKPAKKRVTRGKGKAVKETVPEKAEAKVEEPKKQVKRKPKTEKKALKRKTAKKTEERGE